MGKAKQFYTLDEAMQLLGVNRTTLLVLLSSMRSDINPQRIKKISTRELEQIYGMLRRRDAG